VERAGQGADGRFAAREAGEERDRRTSRVWTIGHSTRPLSDFLALLGAHHIGHVVDVRRFPASRRHPHFEREALARALDDLGVGYTHEEDLGGRRTPRADSPNTGWRAAGFRGYADYMETAPFRAALARLEACSIQLPTTVMCAEAVPWRCHRQLIADALVALGHEVRHILSLQHADVHRLSAFAQVLPDGRLRYDGKPEQLDWTGE